MKKFFLLAALLVTVIVVGHFFYKYPPRVYRYGIDFATSIREYHNDKLNKEIDLEPRKKHLAPDNNPRRIDI